MKDSREGKEKFPTEKGTDINNKTAELNSENAENSGSETVKADLCEKSETAKAEKTGVAKTVEKQIEETEIEDVAQTQSGEVENGAENTTNNPHKTAEKTESEKASEGKAERRKKYRNDIILVSALLLVSLIAIIIMFATKKPGAYAVVEIDGEIVEKLPLDKNGEFSLNGGTNILVIEDGQAYMKSANCPDKVCIHRGKISSKGERIICLPNHIEVYIDGGKAEVDF